MKKQGEFIFVKGNQKLANQYEIKGSPMVLVVDSDGAELARGPIGTGESALQGVLDKAAEKYGPKTISWSDSLSVDGKKKLLVVGFEEGEGETLKGFEDRMVAKYHDQCSFVKLPYEKGSEAAKKWGVSTLPSIYICDASKEAPEKSVLEKLTGKKTPASLKAAIQKALLKVEKKA